MWKVPSSGGLACPVAPAAGSPSISAELDFNFPKSVFLVGLLVLALPNTVAFPDYANQLAQLSVFVLDETNQPLISDTRGTRRGTLNAPPAASLLTLFGRAFHPFALQRPIASLDRWTFSIQNRNTATAQTLEGIYLLFEEAFVAPKAA